ncbi:hypothetical protein LEP1GSC008_0443 [Leptospira kirschneri serovar Bulgarica str. Nikolaevo]|uniref:Uncharacterized protein n=1 Tax=Leptospira kirschneri serovar Bulgarica str. Nikolaevo TaxID=1240687 RepID=M6F7A2_9LEPT|nr:hypothetical protein LEP1GSC008_0443 [Leptospira kirschneri serovar Bulgarica str. Nikolaevo]
MILSLQRLEIRIIDVFFITHFYQIESEMFITSAILCEFDRIQCESD